MEYRRLGTSGLRVSVLSYGAWVTFKNQINVDQVKTLMQACRDAGVNFFDNAEVYSNGEAEKLMGQAIKELGWKRSDIVVSTKIFWGGSGPNDKGLSRKHIIEGTKACLERLQMDYVDLIFCHRPDPDTPIIETVRAMNWLIDQGLAFYWGTSEWSAAQLEEAWEIADRLLLMGPAMEQPQYNMLNRARVEKEYKDLIQKRGMGLTIWSPLSSGVLTGKYSGGALPEGSRLSMPSNKVFADRLLIEKRAQVDAVDRLKPIAESLGVTLAQLALAWCMRNPDVSTVITGATSIEQVNENMKALAIAPKLTPEILKDIDAVIRAVSDLPE